MLTPAAVACQRILPHFALLYVCHMDELSLVARIRALSRSRLLGDDCAVLSTKPGEDLLVTTDLFLENVHFTKNLPPREAGRKCLARGLSDIAAMGGVPRWCFVSLALSSKAPTRWLDAFYEGLTALARQHKVILASGDLTRAKTTAADIVVIGAVPNGTALTRSGARPGDAVFVSGFLGRAAAADYNDIPEPRLALGRFLRQKLHATSCLDLSDGLSLDLHRLCLESKVSAAIHRLLPIAPGASLLDAVHCGEDYELLFTVLPDTKVPAAHHDLPLTQIGTVTKGRPGALAFFGRPLKPAGWDPFRKRASG
jgi:thiamine-monophosphate kinase